MIARFPAYYKDFHCIADKCKHSCCVGWEISVDPETLKKYHELGREDILCNLKDGEILLTDGDCCPFLCDSGLCRLISELGEDYTSIICREHPRFYHRVGEFIEGGIGVCCEEAARIVLASDNYSELIQVSGCSDCADETDFDTLSHRERIYDLLCDRSVGFWDRISRIKDEYNISDILTDGEWNEILLNLDYLYPEHRGVLRVGCEGGVDDEDLERFFAYLVFRHVSIATSYDGIRARLGFSILLTRILGGEFTHRGAIELARVISEEIEYSVENTDRLVFEFESMI